MKMNETLEEIASLPPDLSEISTSAWMSILAYGILFLLGVSGNVHVFLQMTQTLKYRPTPMNKIILHLCIADSLVVFIYIPVEILWRISIGWHAGNLMCKGIQFFRTFGFYLSSLILISISLDRYYAIVHPLRVVNATQRIRGMTMAAWITAAICSSLQCFIFRVEEHPEFPTFKQCRSSELGEQGEFMITMFSLSVMYFIPLFVIVYSYSRIIFKISQEASLHSQNNSIVESPFSYGLTEAQQHHSTFLRRSGTSNMRRARNRTVKLTFAIIFCFIFCWSPYVIITLWHMFGRDSAKQLGSYQEIFFLMAVANSCANPFIYGILTRKKIPLPNSTITTIAERRTI